MRDTIVCNIVVNPFWKHRCNCYSLNLIPAFVSKNPILLLSQMLLISSEQKFEQISSKLITIEVILIIFH